MIFIDKILTRDYYTEKFTAMASALNKYTFEVHRSANKNIIKDTVEKAFGVDVVDVNMVVRAGKLKRDRSQRGRYGRTSCKKFAIVSIKKEQKIEIV
ncbi:MAG: 50S ribosomal protein L23 [Puniceicoccales bacterium]|jgi:large subunit ribosomal protein L23|nr:50S ribosomal protein L23 [Puniceicoccales bacterium]